MDHSSLVADSLVDRLFAEEFTFRDAQRFLAYAAGKSLGKRRFHFNVFDVVIDLDSATAKVEDVLEPDSSETIPLQALAARIHLFAENSARGQRADE